MAACGSDGVGRRRVVDEKGDRVRQMGPSFQRERSCDRHLLIRHVPSPFLAPLAASRRFGDPSLTDLGSFRSVIGSDRIVRGSISIDVDGKRTERATDPARGAATQRRHGDRVVDDRAIRRRIVAGTANVGPCRVELTIELTTMPTDDVRASVREGDHATAYPPEQRHGLAIDAIFRFPIRFFAPTATMSTSTSPARTGAFLACGRPSGPCSPARRWRAWQRPRRCRSRRAGRGGPSRTLR